MNELHEPLMIMAKNIGHVADAIDGLARSVKMLGNGDACTPMGGLEALGLEIEKASERLAIALESRGE